MADIKNFSSDEILTIIKFYMQYERFSLIQAMIEHFPLSVLNEILEDNKKRMKNIDETLEKYRRDAE